MDTNMGEGGGGASGSLEVWMYPRCYQMMARSRGKAVQGSSGFAMFQRTLAPENGQLLTTGAP